MSSLVSHACAVVYRENVSGQTEPLCLIDANYILRSIAIESFATNRPFDPDTVDCLSPEIIYKVTKDYLNSSLSTIEGTKRAELRIKCLALKLEGEPNVSPKAKNQEQVSISSSLECPVRETTACPTMIVANVNNYQNQSVVGMDNSLIPIPLVSTVPSEGTSADCMSIKSETEVQATLVDSCFTATPRSGQMIRSDGTQKSKSSSRKRKNPVILSKTLETQILPLVSQLDEATSTAGDGGDVTERVGQLTSSSMKIEPLVEVKIELPASPSGSKGDTLSDKDLKGNKKNTCSICLKEYSSKHTLRFHMKIHTDEKPHQCDLCGKSFRQRGSLTQHLNIHKGVKPFACPTCDKTFRTKYHLSVHIRRHKGERPYKCIVCGQGFSTKDMLSVHMRVHTKEKPHLCSICGKGFAQRGGMLAHFSRHGEQRSSWFKCDVCDKSFPIKNKFEVHKRTHTGEKPFICDQCGKGFTSSSYLSQHRRVHEQSKHQCLICGKSYSWANALQQHLKTCFEGMKT